MDGFSENILSKLDKERIKYLKQGGKVINLSVGTPDFPPDLHVMEEAAKCALDAQNYKYTLSEPEELIEAVSGWYKRRYNVSLAKDEIMAVYGSQEGLSHIFFTLINPGDIVLVPDPGYPIFSFGPYLAGAKVVPVPLKEENKFLIDFDSIDEETASKAKAIVVSYPNNPTTASANDDFYIRLIAFAKKYNILVIHDNAYSELVLNGSPAKSFLEYEGARDIGVEFNSLSKSYNLTGTRISFVLGNCEIISAFKKLRSQIDYGHFAVVQKIAIAALNGPQDILERNRRQYKLRRDALAEGLNSIGWRVPVTDSTMFTWYPIPEKYNSGDVDFTFTLLNKTGIIVVPGSSFGEYGKGYVRFALVQPIEILKEAASLIQKNGIL